MLHAWCRAPGRILLTSCLCIVSSVDSRGGKLLLTCVFLASKNAPLPTPVLSRQEIFFRWIIRTPSMHFMTGFHVCGVLPPPFFCVLREAVALSSSPTVAGCFLQATAVVLVLSVGLGSTAKPVATLMCARGVLMSMFCGSNPMIFSIASLWWRWGSAAALPYSSLEVVFEGENVLKGYCVHPPTHPCTHRIRSLGQSLQSIWRCAAQGVSSGLSLGRGFGAWTARMSIYVQCSSHPVFVSSLEFTASPSAIDKEIGGCRSKLLLQASGRRTRRHVWRKSSHQKS